MSEGGRVVSGAFMDEGGRLMREGDCMDKEAYNLEAIALKAVGQGC